MQLIAKLIVSEATMSCGCASRRKTFLANDARRGTAHTRFPSDRPEARARPSRPIIDRIYADIREDDTRRIWAGNAVEFFRLGN
jgi:hypothetical protein